MKKVVVILVVLYCCQIQAEAPDYLAPVKITAGGSAIRATYAIPCFADWDGDGLDDLLLGMQDNDGAVAFYRNTGSNNNPKFSSNGFLSADGKQISLPSP